MLPARAGRHTHEPAMHAPVHPDIRRQLALPHEAVVARARDRLRQRVRRRDGSWGGLRPAAVAVMLLDLDGITHVPLTRRSPRLRTHPGEVTLPGGVRDAQDASPVATALRESHEEVGVAPHLLEVLGLMDDEPTTSGFVITPVVARLRQRPRYVPNPDEVAQVLEVPLQVFGDRTRAKDLGAYQAGGEVYRMRAYSHGDQRITGATARILERLSELVLRPG